MTPERTAEVGRICSHIAAWAEARPDVIGAALVGSWARGEATPASDVDVVVLVTDPATYVETTGWVDDVADPAGGGELVATRDWGAITERRVRLDSGLEIEFGFGEPSWAATAPVDPGTGRVVTDGCQVLFDRDGTLERLLAAI